VRDLVDGQDAHPRGGELDGERHPIQPAANLADGPAVRRCERERGEHGLRAVHEELHRLGAGERRHEPRDLAGDAQRLTTGGQHR
jgi:hypothetical protein